MIKLKTILNEAQPQYVLDSIKDAKRIFKELQKMYPKIPKFPLKFKNLNGRGGGYITTSHRRGSKIYTVIDMVIDNSGMWSNDPDYSVCHEFAHVILAHKNGNLTHNATHSNLTYKLAKKFGLA
jgi:Zn-dependent peptidase ImmA (M78 family)